MKLINLSNHPIKAYKVFLISYYSFYFLISLFLSPSHHSISFLSFSSSIFLSLSLSLSLFFSFFAEKLFSSSISGSHMSSPTISLRICLVGGVEIWEDRKWENDRKVEGKKKFGFFSYVFS